MFREFTSHATLLGIPLVHYTSGRCPGMRGWLLPGFAKRVGVYYRIDEDDRRVRVVGIRVEK